MTRSARSDAPRYAGSGLWFRTADDWLKSSQHAVRTGEARSELTVRDPSGPDGHWRIEPEDVWAIAVVAAEALYGGAWFVGSASTPRDRISSEITPVPFDDGDADVYLARWYDEGALFDAAAAVPGVTVHDPRGSNGQADITVPLTAIEGYRAIVTPVERLTIAGATWMPRIEVDLPAPAAWSSEDVRPHEAPSRGGRMITSAEAERLLLDDLETARADGGIDAVPVRPPLDYGPYWVLTYQSRAFVEDGDVTKVLAGNGPFVVPKDGRPPFRLGTSRPLEVQMARLLALEAADTAGRSTE